MALRMPDGDFGLSKSALLRFSRDRKVVYNPPNIRFVPGPPVPNDVSANWVVIPTEDHGGIAIGDPTDRFTSESVVVLDVNNYMDAHTTVCKIIDLFDADLDREEESDLNRRVVYMTSSNIDQSNSAAIFACCFLKYYFKMTDKDAVDDFNFHLTMRMTSEGRISYGKCSASDISFYNPPPVVLVTGDRYSSLEFEELMMMELSNLPPNSIIVHGGCKGIDMLSDRIARELNLEVRTYPAEWDVYGRAAGPIRNQLMLTSENPDLVLAFHPDIQSSRGTKCMMTLAYKYINPVTMRRPDIYLHSLKRKVAFEGDFDVL